MSGPLSHALPRHAGERARHFFLFLFALRAACNTISDRTGRRFEPADLVQEAATHQIDSGLRGSVQRDAFDNADRGMVDQNATSFRSIDAAHYCNLGLGGDFATLKSLAGGDPASLQLVELCEVFAGNTVWLPQQINLGPDRVVDQLHYELAIEFLGEPEPVFKRQHIGTYANRVDGGVRAYADAKDRAGEHGLAACARCYLAPYTNLVAIIGVTVEDNIRSECEAYDLDRSRYIGA